MAETIVISKAEHHLEKKGIDLDESVKDIIQSFEDIKHNKVKRLR